MSTAEIRARQIFDEYNLVNENEDVKRNLMVLLLTVPRKDERKFSYQDAFDSLSGAWENNGMTAEEEIDAIYEARQNGKTRDVIEL